MENMFKDVSSIISVKLISEKNCKISSLVGAFQNCEKLNYFEINGFHTASIKSLKNTFYLSSNLERFNFSNFNTKF